jgi:hypothetical protein
VSVTIMITDRKGESAFLVTGALPRGAAVKPKNAVELGGWIARQQVFRALLSLTPTLDEHDIWISSKAMNAVQPFGVDSGDCLYNTGSLFCYSGARTSGSSNVLMVLWGFPLKLQARKRGDGRLNSGPAAGGLAAGDIKWDIVAVNSPIDARVGDWDMAMRAMTVPVDVKKNPF